MNCFPFSLCSRRKPQPDLPEIHIHPPTSSIAPSYQPPSILPAGTNDPSANDRDDDIQPLTEPTPQIPTEHPITDPQINTPEPIIAITTPDSTPPSNHEKTLETQPSNTSALLETVKETEEDNSKTFKSIDSLNDPFSTASDLLRTWTKQAKEFEELCEMDSEFKGIMGGVVEEDEGKGEARDSLKTGELVEKRESLEKGSLEKESLVKS